MASRNFTNLADHMARARINFGADTFKALLVSSIPTEANLDAWAFRSSVTNEHASTGGYTAGGVAVTATVGTVDAVNDRVAVTFAASNPVLTDSTISAVGAIVYKDTGTAGTSPLAHFIDFGETVASTNGAYNLSFAIPYYINANPA